MKIRRYEAIFRRTKAYRLWRRCWKKYWFKVALVVVVLAAFVISFNWYNTYDSYEDYETEASVRIDSSSNSKYEPFEDFVLKYSNEGVSYIDGEKELWNESYDMQTPIIDVCESYFAIADKNTNDIIVFNKKGKIGNITTNYPLIDLDVARQGVVAALLQEQNASYIEIYDSSGERLVSHKSLLNENGYPIAISLSQDGTKLMVSYVTTSKGSVKERLVFYNFSSKGRKFKDGIVGEFEGYGDSFIPSVKFMTNSDAAVVGEDLVDFYSVDLKPSLKEHIEIKEKIQKVFYSDNYVGLVFNSKEKKNASRIEVYNKSGKQLMNKEVDFEFESIRFANNKVLLYNSRQCDILSFKGIEKFKYHFKENLLDIVPTKDEKFLIMYNTRIEKISLE